MLIFISIEYYLVSLFFYKKVTISLKLAVFYTQTKLLYIFGIVRFSCRSLGICKKFGDTKTCRMTYIICKILSLYLL